MRNIILIILLSIFFASCASPEELERRLQEIENSKNGEVYDSTNEQGGGTRMGVKVKQ